MTEEQNESLKIKKAYTIKVNSKPIEKQIKFTKWMDAQSNALNSILSLIEHSIDRYGYVDITDYDTAKQMYAELTLLNEKNGYNNDLKSKNQTTLNSHKEAVEPVRTVEKHSEKDAASKESGINQNEESSGNKLAVSKKSNVTKELPKDQKDRFDEAPGNDDDDDDVVKDVQAFF